MHDFSKPKYERTFGGYIPVTPKSPTGRLPSNPPLQPVRTEFARALQKAFRDNGLSRARGFGWAEAR